MLTAPACMFTLHDSIIPLIIPSMKSSDHVLVARNPLQLKNVPSCAVTVGVEGKISLKHLLSKRYLFCHAP